MTQTDSCLQISSSKQSSTVALSRYSFPDNPSLPTTSTTTRPSPYILFQRILEHSGSLQYNNFGSITS